MDQWDFKKWRKNLGLNQVVAGEMLGLSRGAVQYWESDLRPVPRAVELACQELLRRWKQRPEYGPVTLLYSDGPVSEADCRPSGDLVLRCEPHPDNESALGRVVRLSETPKLFMPLVWMTMEPRSGPAPNCCRNARSGKDAIGKQSALRPNRSAAADLSDYFRGRPPSAVTKSAGPAN